jgi:carbonic anhydrase/acetyltransferase-like protein (isoleucine patch superfamily)
MRKVLLRRNQYISPFNEPARDLRILNKPLWLHQRDLLARYTTSEREVGSGQFADLPDDAVEQLILADNLFFDESYFEAFIKAAIASGKPCRAAFTRQDRAFWEHAYPLTMGFTAHPSQPDLYWADLWYFPAAVAPSSTVSPEAIVIDSIAREIGYYWVPTYMAVEQGDLIFQVPLRGLLSIESWVHIFIADSVYGVFARGAQIEARLERDWRFTVRVFWRSLLELRQVLNCSELVKIGRGCTIDPTAIIHGPTSIGDNVTIGAGVVIDNCIIGNNVNVSNGCNLQLSVIGDGCFLPFRAALWLTTLMENSMVAQNTCLQMCVVGRNTFIGAGNTFTDYNLLPVPIRALDGAAKLAQANREVLGGCVGHNCRIGSGMVVFPSRTIESDCVLFASEQRRIIRQNVTYEESDHHATSAAHLHQRLYPRQGEITEASW